MTAARSLIRTGFSDVLTAAETAAGSRVYRYLVSALDEEEDLPAVSIWTPSDVVASRYSDTPHVYRRELELLVQAVVREETEERAQDALDLLAGEIELAIERSIGLPAIESVDIDPDASGLRDVELDYVAQGKRTIGGARLRYRIIYDQAYPSDPIQLRELRKLGVDWDLAPADGATEARDTVDLAE